MFGATDPIRTDDLLITSELLYLLSHSSIFILEQTQYTKFAPCRQEKIANGRQKTFKMRDFSLDKGKCLWYSGCRRIWESSRVAKGDRL